MKVFFRIACVLSVVLAWSAAAHAATFTVTTTDDGDHGSCGVTCTLRDAITAANSNAGADTIEFTADGVFPTTSALPAVTGPVTIDGTTAPTYSGTPTVVVRQSGGFEFQAGLLLVASGITVKALELKDYTYGVYITGPGGDIVEGSVAHSAPTNYRFGIVVVDSPDNQIGGTGADDGNTIEDMTYGVVVVGASTGNHIEGNLVRNNLEGVLVESPSNAIGGAAAGAGNTVTGNTYDGIVVYGKNATGNVIQGNLVGSLDGTPGARNGITGIAVAAPNTLVGGTSSGARNVVSGNAFDYSDQGGGILLLTSGNTIQGNYIGTDASGTAAAGNVQPGIRDLAGGNTIGGTTPGAGNVVSGNSDAGISIWKSGDVVQGNYVGLDSSGTAAIPNGIGIAVYASSTMIGGTESGAGNVVSGNAHVGIDLGGTKFSKNLVQGNLVGTDAAGTAALPNTGGIRLGGSSNRVGGTTPAERNIVSGNNGAGIEVYGKKNVIAGNYIGTDVTGAAALPNTGAGIMLGGPSVTVGGITAGAGNLISGNTGSGIEVPGTGKVKSLIAGNRIGTNADGTSALGNSGDGIRIEQVSGITIGGATPGAGNLISGNAQYGIEFFAPGATAKNLVAGNLVGPSADGTNAVGNLAGGINLTSMGTSVGGQKPGLGNVISGNGDSGIFVRFTGNTIYGNAIGTQIDRSSPLGNAGYGIQVEETYSAPTGPIGSQKAGLGNVIAFNAQGGVVVYFGTATGAFGNSFFENGGLAIDLGGDGPTPNDPLDPDTGPDGLQNFPILNPTTIVNGNLIISGTLSSAPGSYTVYLYSNLPSDAAPQARTMIGLVKMKVGGSGDGTFSYSSLPLPVGTTITAVATDSTGAASEVSAAVAA